jgi:bacteriocin-like protein
MLKDMLKDRVSKIQIKPLPTQYEELSDLELESISGGIDGSGKAYRYRPPSDLKLPGGRQGAGTR